MSGILMAASVAILSAGPAAAQVLPPNVSGSVAIGRAGKHGRYKLDLSIPNDYAVVLTVSDHKLRELPYSEWNRYAVAPSSPLASGILRADFGSLGEVSLRFQREGSKRGEVPDHCRGRPPLKERGTYRGVIRLRGEDGLFSVDRVAVPGARRHRFSLVCGAGPTVDPSAARPLDSYVVPTFYSQPSAEAQLEILTVTAERSVAFEAREESSSALQSLGAGVLETDQGMSIGRYSYLGAPGILGPAESAQLDASRLTAEVDGVAFNDDPATAATWSGELETTFLGGRRFVVNGPGSRTRLCAPDWAGPPCVGESAPVFSGTPFEVRS